MPTPRKIKLFYHSPRWKRVRDYKLKLERGRCEICGAKGLEVHHKIPLTMANVDNPAIALSLDNLQLLCTSCHNAQRGSGGGLRPGLEFSPEGQLIRKTDKK